MSGAPIRPRLEARWQSVRRARYAAATPRYLASAVLAVFFLLGVRACFFAAPTPGAAISPPLSADAPSQDYALQFARAYLSYDALHPGRRVQMLAPYVGDKLSSGAGFTPSRGSQSVIWAQVASDQPALVGGRVITVAAALSTRRLPVYLAVTVRHDSGRRLELGGYPSFVGAPSIAAHATSPQLGAVGDPVLAEVVDRALRHYLDCAADDLEADLSADAEVTLPTQRLRLQSVDQLGWLPGSESRAVLATLTATDAGGATYTLAYELGIAYRGRPYVDFIEVIPSQT
jgi:hypothetical protein